MNWKHAVIGATGTSHISTGTPCQDAWGSRIFGKILVCAISDGAGSARYSDRGSKIIVAAALEFFATMFAEAENSDQTTHDLDQSSAVSLVTEIRHQLAKEANASNCDIFELAGTMLVGVFHPDRSVFYQIGDGVWCVSHLSVLGAVTWPHHGEYAGQTEFVTSPNAINSIQFESIQGTIDFAVGMSDGLERLALNLQACIPHAGFITPLIEVIKANHDQELLHQSLQRFLESERICERTDDDKSIALIANA